MSIQVGQHDVNQQRGCINRPHKMLDDSHKVRFRAAGGDLDAPPFTLGFDGYKEVARPVAPIFVVLMSTLAGLYVDRRASLSEKLLALLIDANHGLLRVIRSSIEPQQTIHSGAVLGRGPTDAPHYFAPGLA